MIEATHMRKYREHTYLIWVVILLAAIMVVTWNQGGVINNGDYHRVSDSMSIHADAWKPLEAHHQISVGASTPPPTSTMGFIGWFTTKFHLLAGAKTLNTWAVAAVLWALYFSGAIALAVYRPRVPKILLASVLLAPLAYGMYFRSLYEEAAVLALTPWLAFSIVSLHRTGRCGLFLIVGAGIILTKAQMIFVLPLLILALISGLCAHPSRLRFAKMAAGTLGLTVVALSYAAYLAKAEDMSKFNNYDRLYNGVGWSLQHSASWPAHDFNARNSYFYAHRSSLQSVTEKYEPISGKMLLGTSYWPSGEELYSAAKDPSGDQAAKDRYNIAIGNGKFGSYFHFLAKHPVVLVDLVSNTYLTALVSNYSLDYLKNPQSKNWATSKISSMVGGGLFVASLAVTLWLASVNPQWVGVLASGYYLLGAPMFIVLGDGYYEFEKHMASYLMLLPIIIALMTSALRRQAAAARAPHSA